MRILTVYHLKHAGFDLPGLRFPERRAVDTARPQDGTAPGAPGEAAPSEAASRAADSEASGLSAEVAALVKAAKAKEWRPAPAVQAGLVQPVQLGFQGFQLGGISVGVSRSNSPVVICCRTSLA